MPTDTGAVHLLVETLGDEPTIVAENDVPRQFRKISNVLRGSSRTSVLRVINSVVDERRAALLTVTDGPGRVVGIPVLGPDHTVFAIHLYIGGEVEPTSPSVAGWQWELGIQDLPPRLLLSGEFFEIYGIGDGFRDRTVYGPADYFARIARLSDVVDIWTTVKKATVGDKAAGAVIIRRESGGLALIHHTQRCVDTPSGPRLRGFSWEVPQAGDAALRTSVVDEEVTSRVLGIQGAYAYIADLTFPRAPCVVKWLTSWVPDIGHGVSTGQTPSIHPDDQLRIVDMIAKHRDTAGPVTTSMRVRRAGGGWLTMRLTAQWLDRQIWPALAVVIIHPDSITGAAAPPSVS